MCRCTCHSARGSQRAALWSWFFFYVGSGNRTQVTDPAYWVLVSLSSVPNWFHSFLIRHFGSGRRVRTTSLCVMGEVWMFTNRWWWLHVREYRTKDTQYADDSYWFRYCSAAALQEAWGKAGLRVQAMPSLCCDFPQNYVYFVKMKHLNRSEQTVACEHTEDCMVLKMQFCGSVPTCLYCHIHTLCSRERTPDLESKPAY